MQLFVVYFGLPLLGLNVSAWLAVAIALTAHISLIAEAKSGGKA